MNSLITKPGVHVLILLWAIASFVFFQFFYSYHLFYQEQNQLFLFSWDYIITYLDKPGWLACLAGDFLTQFYYYRYAGPTILTLSILMAGYNVRCGVEDTDIKGTWIPYTIAIAVMTMLVCFSFHYDYRLSSIIAVAGGANVFRFSTKILVSTRMFVKKLESLAEQHTSLDGTRLPQWITAFSIFTSMLVCHWFFGCGMWVYAALVLLGCIKYINKPGNYTRLAAIAIPLFLIMLDKRLYFIDLYTAYTHPGIGKFVKPQMDLEKTLAADCEYYFGNYNTVVNMVEKDKEPNQYMKFYYNLVSAQGRSLPAVLLKYPNNYLGTFETLGPDTPPLTIKTINELYWILGDMTFCERAAILANVCSPENRNIRMMKRLAEINLVKGDYDAARKYLRILQKTFVWSRWANRAFDALGKKASSYDKALLQQYIDKRPYLNTRDTLRLNDNCHTIMSELMESNPNNNIAINYMLCSDLLLKDMETFKHDYDAYYLKQQNIAYETLYQEALASIWQEPRHHQPNGLSISRGRMYCKGSSSIMNSEATLPSRIPTGITSTRQRHRG